MAADPTPQQLLLARLLRGIARAETRLWSAITEGLHAALDLEQRRALTAAIYTLDGSYATETPASRRGLKFWEAEAIAAHFPAPPARILVLGAGGGREVWPLAERGHAVLACEPHAGFHAGLAARARQVNGVTSVRASYEDLLREGPARATVRDRAPYGAVLLGWASFCNILDPADVTGVLELLRELCPAGPVLLSFLERSGAPAGSGPLRRSLRSALGVLGLRHPAPTAHDEFSLRGGFHRRYHREDLAALAARTGYQVAMYRGGEVYPHAVLRPRPAGR